VGKKERSFRGERERLSMLTDLISLLFPEEERERDEKVPGIVFERKGRDRRNAGEQHTYERFFF